MFLPVSIIFWSLVLFYVLFRCVYVCFQQWQYYPHPQGDGYVCLVIENFYIYVSYFFIFLYGYLLHYVVYKTVVCINTIIYFSMENKDSKANNYKPGKMRLQHTEVGFSNK